MLKELIKIANDLDAKGFTAEADALDEIIKEAMNPLDIMRNVGVLTGLLGDDEEDPMDIAEKQEAEAQKAKYAKRLKDSENWFTENIFISTEDKFPVSADRELFLGMRFERAGLAGVQAKEIAFPVNTQFDSLEQEKPLKNGGKMSLREAWTMLTDNLRRFSR